jgi:serine protease Do
MNNNNYNQYGQYQQYRPVQQRPVQQREMRPPPRKRGAPTGLVIFLALLAGFVGGSLSPLMFREDPAAQLTAAMLPSFEALLEPTEPATEASAPAEITETQPEAVEPPPPVIASIAEDVAAAAASSVVEVTTESKVTHPFFGNYVTEGAGSGVVFSADGFIVTNHHVIVGSTSVTVRMSDGTEYPAELIGSDQQTDLAVLKVDAAGLSAVAFADSDTVVVGQPVVAIGNPLGSLGGTVTEGIISAKDREIVVDEDEMTLLQTSAAINPGNSGGGLFDGDSQLVGVVNAKFSADDIEGLGFAIPANTVKFIVTELIENGYVTGRPSLGVEAVQVGTREELYYYGVNDYGVYVSEVNEPSNPLQPGDRLIQVGESRITSLADVKNAISHAAVGDHITISLQRGGQVMQVEVTLQEVIEQ